MAEGLQQGGIGDQGRVGAMRWAARGLLAQLPPFTRRQWQVFSVCGIGGFFDNYDRSLLSLCLRDIQLGLGIAEAQVGRMLSVIRLGSLGAFLLSPLADVFGRRRLLLIAIAGYTVFTCLSAVTLQSAVFVGWQCLARCFAGAQGIVALVVLVEEVNAEVRGWAIGLLGVVVLTGWGLAALFFALIQYLPFGWRTLYLPALLPLMFLRPLARLLPETWRFQRVRSEDSSPLRLVRPLGEMLTVYPTRLGMTVTVSFLYTLGGNAVTFFYPKYLLEVHHWSPPQVTALVIFGGLIGISGNLVAGRLSDLVGRRYLASLLMILAPLSALWIFRARGAGVIPAWTLELFLDTAAGTIVGVYSAELFPTSYRSAAAGAMMAAGTLGGALGLFLESWLYHRVGSHWEAVQWLVGFWFFAALVIFLFFPETAGVELEAISPGRVAGSED